MPTRGNGVTGHFWLGWLTNEQHRASLSRLQMFLWTAIVLSAFLVAALANLKEGHATVALAIAIPQEVWVVMGISTVSLVGSPLILSQKKRQKTNVDELERTLRLRGMIDDTQTLSPEMQKAHASGNLDRNSNPQQAHLYDLIRGEEVGNSHVLDLTRLQNLFFTFVLIGAYAANLGSLLVSRAAEIPASSISQFPPIGASSIALLGISHAGYLTGKAVDKQPEGK
jgi:hypothetical protein